ncbi:MAG: tetratricopeptide repeat protein [Elusimicrobia bacterium]|nr:tetratricopeptide repeat protein [Elusimicrobiota bacterium]
MRWTAIFGAALLWGGGLQAADPGRATLRRLTGEATRWRGIYGAVLAAGLKEDASAITPPEREIMGRVARSPGVAAVVYLNRYGQVRWSEDPELISLPLEEYQKRTGAVLQAAAEVMTSTAARVRQAPDAPVYEAAIPIVAEGATQGVLDLWVRRDGLFGLLSERPQPAADAPPRPAAAPSPEAGRRQAQQSYLSGMVYFEKGDYEKALKEWETARKFDPEDQDVAAGLARVRRLLGRTSASGGPIPLQAAPTFDRSETRSDDQRRSQQHYLAGIIYYDKADYAKAREEWMLASRIDPDNADAAAGLRRVDRLLTPDDSKNCVNLYQERRYDDAAAACAACLERDPDSAACGATRRLMEGRVP